MEVIGGGVSEADELLLEPTAPPSPVGFVGRGFRPIPEIRKARLGDQAALLIGAADLSPPLTCRAGCRHRRFVAVPLAADVAALDYEAYMSSPDVIRGQERWSVARRRLHVRGRPPADRAARGGPWSPTRSLAFALLSPAGDRGLGCLYLNPLRDYLERVGAKTRAALVGVSPLRHGDLLATPGRAGHRAGGFRHRSRRRMVAHGLADRPVPLPGPAR